MSAAADHLSTLPVLYINVDGHTERAQRFEDQMGPYFKETIRVPAVPIVDAVEEANDFSARVRISRLNDPHGFLKKFPKIYTIEKFTSETKRAREYAATRSLTLSTLKAVMMAKEAGYSRFMLCDDDAAPRPQVIEEMPMPPEAEIRVWGGAYSSGGLRRDNERFLASESPKWVDISKNTTRFFSQAYEMTPLGADWIEWAIRSHFNAVDLMWWNAFVNTTAYTLQPSAFTQVGESVRVVKHNPRTREGDTVR